VRKSGTRGPTRSLGGVFHLTSWASVYGNKSTNFGPPRGTTVGPDAVIGPNTFGEGIDYGLRFNLLQNRIFLEVGYFDTSSQNVTEVLNLNLRTPDSIAGAYNSIFGVLAAPVGAPQLFNPADTAQVAALKAAYSDLRPTFNATGDLMDQASRGYESRLTANLTKGLRIRATFARTEREREGLYKYTLVAARQLREYVGELQAKNPTLNVGSLFTAADPIPLAQHLANFDTRIDEGIDRNANNFGAGKLNFNIVATYEFQRILKGLTVSANGVYKSGGYTGVYEVREGGVSTGKLLDSISVFGESTIDYGAMMRYRMKLPFAKQARFSLQLNVTNLLDETDPVVRRTQTAVIAPGATPPPASSLVPTSYFVRVPRSWTLSGQFDF
jgi:iron complex outermembrane recepter protein